MKSQHNTKKNVPVNRIQTGALVLSFLALLLPGCGNNSNLANSENASPNPTTAEVSKNTEDYVGKTVSVRDEVQKVVAEYAFLLDEDAVFGGEEILVINAGEPLTLPDGEGTDVQVNGEVQRLNVAQLKSQYGLDLDPDLLSEYEDKPVIVARSVALAPDPEEITENPEKYYNQRIAVQGEVEDLMSNGMFTLNEEKLFGGEGLLVVTTDSTGNLQKDDEVTVAGVLRPYIQAEFDRDYDLNWDLSTQEKVKAEYEQKPVFVAESVYPTPDDAQQ
ncbi:MAG TPA: hypothetical protein V6D29_12225 [Leptolyngbyaceae cyanobacterium]